MTMTDKEAKGLIAYRQKYGFTKEEAVWEILRITAWRVGELEKRITKLEKLSCRPRKRQGGH
jgi:hypothetical protein